MAIVKIEGYLCERCLHSWMPRSKIDELPTICPKCKSPYWNKAKQGTTTTETVQAWMAMQRKRGKIK